ncbi:MAG: glycoside hydrolase family 3 C-terminal domain-containing protein, partial [Treponema sp.]|nr:glycoside hydrolase family 3 C-terminal domain-containing protein [Treponema sp.]
IVVLWEGENYADDAGDYLNNVTLRADDISLLNNAYNTGKPVIAVMISGRPIFITTAQLDLMDAFIAAWLPGSEGGGAIADVLFDADKDFFGKTPFTWRTAYNSTVTFGYGTGLKKGQAGTYEGGTP